MKKGFKQMVAEANGEAQTWTVADAMAALGRSDVAFIDLREPDERARDGVIPGAEPAHPGWPRRPSQIPASSCCVFRSAGPDLSFLPACGPDQC